MLFIAVAIITLCIAPSSLAGALAWQNDGVSPTTMYDETFSDDPTYDPASPEGTVYDDAIYGDPCDPAVYPGWESDPYCNPALSVDDDADYCDPEYYPDWASDPYCNPELDDVAVPAGTAPPGTAPRSGPPPASSRSTNNDTPLIDIDLAQAPAIGAGRMLLAMDAIAELGGFERAITPDHAALLRDIRVSIPAGGLDEDGYAQELESFVDDFIPFLESLDANGLQVSEDLWQAAFDLDDVLFGDASEGSDELDLLEPEPWLLGLGDLLVRNGESTQAETSESDEAAIRSLIEAFAIAESEAPAEPATSTSTTQPPIDETTAPQALALQTSEAAVAEPASDSSSSLPIVAGALVALAIVGGVLFALRSKKRPADAPSRTEASKQAVAVVEGETPVPAGTGSPEPQASKASVTELLDASRRMSASLDSSTIASIALSEANRLVDAEGGIVVRRTDNGLDPVGCEPPMLFNYSHIDDGCLPRVIETGQATAAIAHDDPLLVEVPMAMGAVAIVADGTIVGALLVVRVSARPFNRDELDALEMLAPLIGSAFAVADTHETATELADIEPLTGLANRRRLDLDLASITTDDAVAYVMVDIDHFKNFNDTNGHAAGDEALRQVSALLKSSVRPMDLVYRYGGEEFCVLLPGATAEEAAVVAERARAAVESAIIPGMEQQPAGVVTISVGVSDSAFGTPSDLVERADAALYESKRNGRNRVTLSS